MFSVQAHTADLTLVHWIISYREDESGKEVCPSNILVDMTNVFQIMIHW